MKGSNLKKNIMVADPLKLLYCKKMENSNKKMDVGLEKIIPKNHKISIFKKKH